jgi:hypothetical protein
VSHFALASLTAALDCWSRMGSSRQSWIRHCVILAVSLGATAEPRTAEPAEAAAGAPPSGSQERRVGNDAGIPDLRMPAGHGALP